MKTTTTASTTGPTPAPVPTTSTADANARADVAVLTTTTTTDKTSSYFWPMLKVVLLVNRLADRVAEVEGLVLGFGAYKVEGPL